MKVVVAMNAFKGSLSSVEATHLVAEGFRRGFRECQVVEVPLADGGDGTVEVLTRALGGEVRTVRVTGPLGKIVEARVGLADGGKTAIIESASCSGLALIPPGERDVHKATSKGVGELMLWAARQGARKILVGIGGTAVNDGGIGAAQAAGAMVLDSAGLMVEQGLRGLFAVSRVDPGRIPHEFAGIEIIGICDVDNPLTGPRGSTRVYGPQKGLAAGEIDMVDAAMESYAAILARDLGRDPREHPRAGAGGGLAAALWAFFGARLVDGASFMIQATGLDRELCDAYLVITGEGRVDRQTAMGKVPYAVALAAAENCVPAVVIGGGLSHEFLSERPPEFLAMFSSTTEPVELSVAMERAKDALPFTAEQIARIARVFSLSTPPSRYEVAAGGVVFRKHEGRRQFLLIGDRYGMLALPKGHVEPGESPQDAACREVWEETGVRARIVGDIGTIRYRFFDEGWTTVAKVVHYYVMEPEDDVLHPNYGEVRCAMWVDENEIRSQNTYRDTWTIVRRAAAFLDRTG